jgi:hypothetical protein
VIAHVGVAALICAVCAFADHGLVSLRRVTTLNR